ncbi:rhomboid family intramembrane serine protease [Litoribacillus peritrichatus]
MIVLPTEKRFDWKHAPIMLFSIALLNILVFFLYQSADDTKYNNALEAYDRNNLLQSEWPAFQNYLLEENEKELLTGLRQAYSEEYYYDVIEYIVGDDAFYQYILNHEEQLVFDPYRVNDDFPNWKRRRQEVDDYFYSISSFQGGVIPETLNPVTLISYQFLHGDFYHLLGNLFFLIFCGFAVEAALGAWLFLGLYLASGVIGGLLYAVIDLSSQVPLVGASGSISGVMAMYLGIFRLRKIEFFYWIFVFAGYFRAPALLILPFYIGKELLDFYFNPNSGVAFMCHTGGFIGGGLLMAFCYKFKPDLINNEYVEEDQQLPAEQQSLAKIYAHIDHFRFDQALKAIDLHQKEYGEEFELSLLSYHISQALGKTSRLNHLLALIQVRPFSAQQVQQLAKAWEESEPLHENVDVKSSVKLAINILTPDNLTQVETLFNRLHDKQPNDPALIGLAQKLSFLFEKQKNKAKAKHYQAIADQNTLGSL